VSELELQVSGMTCVHCERAVTAELVRLDGVNDVDANAETGRVRITCSAPLGRAEIEQAISDAGYALTSWSSEGH